MTKDTRTYGGAVDCCMNINAPGRLNVVKKKDQEGFNHIKYTIHVPNPRPVGQIQPVLPFYYNNDDNDRTDQPIGGEPDFI